MRQKKEKFFQQAHPGLGEVPAKRQSWEQISGLKSRKKNCKEKRSTYNYLANAHGGNETEVGNRDTFFFFFFFRFHCFCAAKAIVL